MCGAFTFGQFTQIVKELGLQAGQEFLEDRFNLRPTKQIPVVLDNAPDHIQLTTWGMTPNWGEKKMLLFNTRDDSLIEKPYFNRLLKKHRCIILADSFYEWAKVGNKKLPYRFTLNNNEPFAFAGIWNEAPTTHEPQVSIITTEPNSLVEKLHNRMPVMIPLDHAKEWIQTTDEEKLIKFLKPFNPKQMVSYRVSQDVNSSRSEGPSLIKPIKEKAA